MSLFAFRGKEIAAGLLPNDLPVGDVREENIQVCGL